MCLDCWRRSLVVGLLEAGVVGLVGFEVQTRRERTAKRVEGTSDVRFPGVNANCGTNRCLICVQFILRSFFLSFLLRFFRVS